MISGIRGLHHVTSLAADPQANNDFFTGLLGLRRVKKTVNFDAPDVYHLYYGDETGTPGTVMTCFPLPGRNRGRAGTGEVAEIEFSVPTGALSFWRHRLAAAGVSGLRDDMAFGAARIRFQGPDAEVLALVETANDARAPWGGAGLPADAAIRGFSGVRIRLREAGATGELLEFMGYEQIARQGDLIRYAIPGGNGADRIDLMELPRASPADQGAGSVHHVAFAVEDRATQLDVRAALMDTGYRVTPVIDRDYFWAIYFQAPGGVLFEVATNEPGFARDEDNAHLGEALKLPRRHAHLRARLEASLVPISD